MKRLDRAVLSALLLTAACGPRGTVTAPTSAWAPVGGLRADPADYRVYTEDGRTASVADVVAAMEWVSVVFVGEEHDDSIGHLIEAELLSEAVDRWQPRPVVLSLEMFERDVQGVVDEYLAGLIDEPNFLAAARPWPQYRRAYRPMVELARTRGLPVVVANAPRRYVNMASHLGLESLGRLATDALGNLPPLPLPEPSRRYRLSFDSLMAGPASHDGMPPHIFDGQRLWDATMAGAVAGAQTDQPEALVLHYAGGFHVERRLGAAEALLHYGPHATFLIVAIRTVADPGAFDAKVHAGLGDFVVLTRE